MALSRSPTSNKRPKNPLRTPLPQFSNVSGAAQPPAIFTTTPAANASTTSVALTRSATVNNSTHANIVQGSTPSTSVTAQTSAVPASKIPIATTSSSSSGARHVPRLLQNISPFVQASTTGASTAANQIGVDVDQSDNSSHPSGDEDDQLDEDDEPLPTASQAPLCVEDLDVEIIGRNRYAKAAIDGYEPVLKLLYDEVAADRAAMRSLEWEPFAMTGHAILASMPTSVFLNLMGGNLPRAARQDNDLKKTLEVMKRRCSNHASIYVRFLVDDSGNSPTAAELSRVVNVLRRYAKLDDDPINVLDLVAIDTQFTPYNAWATRDRDARRCLSSDSSLKDHAFIPERVTAVQLFCDALQARLGKIAVDELDNPYPSPLVYVGYALNAETRNTHNHDNHKNSNFMMALTEVICTLLF